MSRVVFLGPQRFSPTLVDVLDRLEVRGTVATVTAGWQEREQEIQELAEHVHREVRNLRLYERADQILHEDEALAKALRGRQNRLRDLQRLYRQRLAHTLEAAREVMRLDGRDRFVREHRQDALRAVRTLDRQHLTRIHRIHDAFNEEWQPSRRSSVTNHRREIEETLADAAVVSVAGGNVGVLLNRMRLFGFEQLLEGRTVVAWSAGAMALCQRIVLFHDRPPQGPGDAEVLDAGLGLVDKIVPLPHARSRLDLDDPIRIALLARRFSPDLPAPLESGTEWNLDESGWKPVSGATALSRRGAVVEMKPK